MHHICQVIVGEATKVIDIGCVVVAVSSTCVILEVILSNDLRQGNKTAGELLGVGMT